ncbi:unnamed protein product [Phytophthora fragariaefolia]|uniref:Unnamed protein product n=1 Tax=Phytophthora fragariaefolia TaxID=1490495 RepID=A0A9W7CVX2_9STRA|nr:unnamed protein product [Phytophthora fragariaefolia]
MRFPLGTRVADPLEGRTGEIQGFDVASGLYALVYSDGHRDELPASEAERFVIRKTPEQQAEEAAQRAADPNQFLGATVTKSSTSYEGETLTSSGQITSYFPDIKRFRVLFPDGLYSDMSLEEVEQNIEETKKRAAEAGDDNQSPRKKSKHHHHHDEEQERPLNTQKFDSRQTAYTICREVLSIIMSQKKVGKLCTEKQKVILGNKDLQVMSGCERCGGKGKLTCCCHCVISRAGSDGQLHVASASATKLTPQQKETTRLEALRTGADTSEETEKDPGEEIVVYLPQFNSLGSEDMRRPVRQTQVIESLAEKINRDYEDSVRKHQPDDEEENDDGVAPGRIRFGKPQLMQFSQHTRVIDLFATARSKLAEKSTTSANGDSGLAAAPSEADDNSEPKPLPMPNKMTAPAKPILKVRDEVITPASQVAW